MDVRALEAGRELDAAIAEKVMGWFGPVVWFNDEYGNEPYLFPPNTPEKARTANDRGYDSGVPEYSTSIALSWQVIRRLYEITTEGQWDWFCDMQNAADIWRKTDREAATIICQSALAVIEAKTTIETNNQ